MLSICLSIPIFLISAGVRYPSLDVLGVLLCIFEALRLGVATTSNSKTLLGIKEGKKKLRLLDEESRNAAAALLQRGCNGPNSLPPLRTSDNLIHETKDFIELRGSPRPASAGGSLVGRGIANPMSERTRGFELPRKKGTKFPLPAPLFLVL